MLLDLVLGFAIGLSLGLLGGGGSILTVPMLVYLVGQTPQAAVTASLAIVGANSVLGALFHRAQGTLNWRVALAFGSSGMIASYLSAGLSKLFSAAALLVAFAVLMIVIVTTISVYLVVYKDAPLDTLLPPDEKDERPKWRWPWQRIKPSAVTQEPDAADRPAAKPSAAP